MNEDCDISFVGLEMQSVSHVASFYEGEEHIEVDNRIVSQETASHQLIIRTKAFRHAVLQRLRRVGSLRSQSPSMRHEVT